MRCLTLFTIKGYYEDQISQCLCKGIVDFNLSNNLIVKCLRSAYFGTLLRGSPCSLLESTITGVFSPWIKNRYAGVHLILGERSMGRLGHPHPILEVLPF